jgi:DNA-binding transcriptional ArsR family regulator
LVLQLLAMKSGDRPDFLTPAPPASKDGMDLRAELDTVRATPASVIAEDLSGYRFHSRMRELVALSEGDQQVKDRVAAGLEQIHRMAFGSDWDAAEASLLAEVTRRSTDLAYLGLEHVLSGLHPRVSFKLGVLTVHSDRIDANIEGTGNGLVFVPSVVASKRLSLKINSRDPIVVVYPIAAAKPSGRPAARPVRPVEQRLRSIVGYSRGSIMLALLAEPRLSTSELARRCGIAVSSASEHTTALREGGLIHSRRERNRMLHTLSAVGIQLARAGG